LTFNAGTDVRPFRLSLSGFFLLQLLIAPAFLAPLYYGMHGRSHPYVMMLAALIAPTGYVAVFSYRAAARAVSQQLEGRGASVVFAALRSGIVFGVLFGTLVLGSLAVLWIRDLLRSDLSWQQFLGECMNAAIAGSIIFAHYSLIGAATGGAVGLAVDVIGRWPFRQRLVNTRL
jgi:hypothetical protein